jgi:microcystin-dependent protein
MASPYVGELRIFAGNFAPAGWLFCQGQSLPISENETLFQLIGTTYGGDGQSTFALPDLRGRIPIHQGQGPGLQSYILAQTGGTEQVTLTTQQMPTHAHPVLATTAVGSAASPQASLLAASGSSNVYRTGPSAVALSNQTVGPTGGSQPHTNFQPYLCVDFIISLFGIFPSPT